VANSDDDLTLLLLQIDLNAPGGVKDYVERYGGNMYELAKQQATARPWQGAVVDEVVNARRNALPLEKLQGNHTYPSTCCSCLLSSERAKWRDRRLMELMAHKLRLDREDKLNQ
jgi:L-gulonate 3-dehydrogenase